MNILIVCGAGISTSIMAAMMEDYVSDQDKIVATSFDRMRRYLDDADVLLAAPQIKNLYYLIEEECKEKNIGCVLLSNDLYGHMDAEKALEIAKGLYKEREERLHNPRIVLICGGGITTGILLQKMTRYAEELGLKLDCSAHGITSLNPLRFKGAKVIVMAPQVRYMVKEVENLYPEIPIKQIETDDFVNMDAKKILLELIDEFDLLHNESEN
jgi:cellobiose PTS system EIIB component